MARNKKTRKGAGKKVYSIIVDGQTEVWYLQMMKRHENLSNIKIKPELPKKKSLKEQYELVLENAKIYDKVIWILDFDTIIKEEREKKGAIAEFRESYNELLSLENVIVLVNTPCLEFWFLLHFESTGKYFPKCDDARKALKKHLPDYKKSEKYFVKTKPDIYQRLKPNHATAIQNAYRLGGFDIDNPQSAKAEIYKLFCILEIQECNHEPSCLS